MSNSPQLAQQIASNFLYLLSRFQENKEMHLYGFFVKNKTKKHRVYDYTNSRKEQYSHAPAVDTPQTLATN